MDRWRGKVAVVTGASAGIGLATVRSLLHHELIVVGLSRRKDKMEEEAKSFNNSQNFYARQCDMSNEQSVRDAFDWIKKHLKMVHMLVNNAGVGKFGKLENVSFDNLMYTINVNFVGLLLCSKLAVAIMKDEKQESHIINISSVFGYQINISSTFPPNNVYPVTKFAVKAMSQVLEKELLNDDIRVTNISPGAVRTDMFLSAGVSTEKFDILEPEDIANAIVYVIGVPPRVQIGELTITPSKMSL